MVKINTCPLPFYHVPEFVTRNYCFSPQNTLWRLWSNTGER